MTTAADLATVLPDAPGTRRPAGAFTRLLRKPMGIIPLLILAVLIVLAILAPVLSTHSPTFASLEQVNAPAGTPGWPLGADQYGRDIWARVLTSLQVSFISAMLGAGIAVVVGTTFGLIAGYVGKRTDAVSSWVFNLVMSFPGIVLLIVLFPVTGGTYQATMLVFGFLLSPGIYRLVRNLVQGVRNELYVDAARVAGLSNRRILTRHVLYVVRGPIVIALAFLASAAIGVQAGLAFLGFGAVSQPSFGSMTSDAFTNIYTAPEQLIWSAGALALLNGSLVLLANAYRDVLSAPQAKAKRRRVKTGEAVVEKADTSTAAPIAPSDHGLLRVRGLRVSYPQADGSRKDVVRGVSLDIAPGEIVGLVGESGSGKTQTAFSILGVLPKQASVVADALDLAGESLLSKDATAMRRLRRGVISYIPQEPMSNLDPSFTVGSQLIAGISAGMSRKEAKDTIIGLLARVGITDPERTYNSYPHQISGGMAQRALIAGAVASRPKLLIADEPTTALDVTVQAEILDLLRDLQAEYGMGVLLVTHNFGVVADLCDRVIVMREGELVESGDVREMFHHPQHPYTQQLIGAILDEDTVRTDPPRVATETTGSTE
ncbi:peptide/nickel transport system permease protein [Rathayibacter sp. PhB93]|uniref:dipeptide/oligopeptide/nickel ABC transporter permease/ATP-binding protein n=1 Tax=unclassified Rathayibacter TaxID=2609250 RepID=UPI000FA72121|nr:MULTISPECIES: dipeptide/oligopeptide/nickel ABC transporter permease/ATP-binding protein [unclassified Rathayibacter]ROQ00949.1 peptide/nickel transport system permease protein [Rathayibacter sp. PhB93]TDQ07303.1 peptide/nickel transport system permease protein [Rathayibacter sp. PhB1]